MVKWIDEKVLQLYFKENCANPEYALEQGGSRFQISSCDFNQPFDKFPDLTAVISGQSVPIEVE